MAKLLNIVNQKSNKHVVEPLQANQNIVHIFDNFDVSTNTSQLKFRISARNKMVQDFSFKIPLF